MIHWRYKVRKRASGNDCGKVYHCLKVIGWLEGILRLFLCLLVFCGKLCLRWIQKILKLSHIYVSLLWTWSATISRIGHGRDKDTYRYSKGWHIYESADFDTSSFFTPYVKQVLYILLPICTSNLFTYTICIATFLVKATIIFHYN